MREYELWEPLKEFMKKVRPYPCVEGEEKTRKQIEDNLIAFIVSGHNSRYLMSWLRFLHHDQEFRERVKTCFMEYIEAFQLDIKFFEHCLDIIDMLGRRSEPDWEKMKWNEMSLIALERFMRLPAE